jgi:choline dehydrogenase-like flavoprotein
MASTNVSTDAQYDYIVVGSGAGGGPVAANLAKAGMKVLLLEAGGDAEPYNYQVPVFHALAAEDASIRWDYFVRHYADDATQRRDDKFVPEKDGIYYPRSGTLGGCTAHNALITVYPFNHYWDDIADLMNDDSWRHENMRKYFMRMEACRYRPIQRLLSYLGINPTRHGFGGWLSTEAALPESALWDHELIKIIADSALKCIGELGGTARRLEDILKSLGDPNDWRLQGEHPEGVYFTPLATRDHARNGSRDRIREIQRRYPRNLTVQTNCLATRILLDESNRAIGVAYVEGEHLYGADPAYDGAQRGKERAAAARREVIVCAGAFNTPQLLMLSGIGPSAELGRHGIRVRVDLPGVGKNLQDRYEVGVVTKMKRDWAVLKGAQFNSTDPLFEQWHKQRKGVYISNGAVLGIIKRSDANQKLPDLFIFALLGKFHGYYPGFSKIFADNLNYLTWAILKSHTHNTAGEVTLRSPDPRDVPYVNFRYFDHVGGGDLESVVNGIEFVRSLQSALDGYMEEEETPGPAVRTRDDLKQFVKDNAWGHHASCSCKIGARQDGGVVDSGFRVYGTQGLRIADASVFPRIPGFFIVTSVYMVGEKASDVILEDAKRTAH